MGDESEQESATAICSSAALFAAALVRTRSDAMTAAVTDSSNVGVFLVVVVKEEVLALRFEREASLGFAAVFLVLLRGSFAACFLLLATVILGIRCNIHGDKISEEGRSVVEREHLDERCDSLLIANEVLFVIVTGFCVPQLSPKRVTQVFSTSENPHLLACCRKAVDPSLPAIVVRRLVALSLWIVFVFVDVHRTQRDTVTRPLRR